jgi:YHS domain-containing protein
MKNNHLIITFLLVFSLMAVASYAMETAQNQGYEKTVINAGNKLCPVSGESVEAMGGGVQHEYNGTVYNLCCAGCVATFDKDPEKYVGIVEQEFTKAVTK